MGREEKGKDLEGLGWGKDMIKIYLNLKNVLNNKTSIKIEKENHAGM